MKLALKIAGETNEKLKRSYKHIGPQSDKLDLKRK